MSYLEELADKLDALAEMDTYVPVLVKTALYRLATDARNHIDTPEENREIEK
jgi:hypothetical protein